MYCNLLAKLDTEAFARVLSEWLSQQAGSLSAALALDGKMVRDTIGVVSMVDTETGTPQAMGSMSMKEGEGDRCKLKAAQKLIEYPSDLSVQLISGDALHAQNRTALHIRSWRKVGGKKVCWEDRYYLNREGTGWQNVGPIRFLFR